MKIFVTGATGFVGTRLCEIARQRHEIVAVTRDVSTAQKRTEFKNIKWISWDDLKSETEAETGIIHLAGESIAAHRWTDDQKKRIYDSRILNTRKLVQAIQEWKNKPKVLVSSSAIGYYGDRGDEGLAEDVAPGNGFLADVCKAWEVEALKAQDLGVRVCLIRTGLVLGSGGGALEKMLPPFRLGLGGPLGNGQQWMSWIHIDDLVGLFLKAVESQEWNGPVNAVTSHPVSNAEFTKVLAKTLKRPAFLRVPRFALQAALGEMASILLASQRVVPEKALALGYSFQYQDLEKALGQAIYGS